MTREEAEHEALKILFRVYYEGIDNFHSADEWKVFIRHIADALIKTEEQTRETTIADRAGLAVAEIPPPRNSEP